MGFIVDRPVWLGTEDGKVADGGESLPWKITKPQSRVRPLAVVAAPDPAIAPSLADDPDFYRTKHLAHKVSYLLRSITVFSSIICFVS